MSIDQRVLFRVDAGMGVGHGHLFRCLTIAGALQARGAEVTVATRTRAPELLQRITDAGCRHLSVPEGTDAVGEGPAWSEEVQVADATAVREAAPEAGWDAVVVDHYRLDRRWEKRIRPCTRRLIVIDDLANRPHDADVLIDHNWYGSSTAQRYAGLVDADALLLLGPRYALLDPAYAEARNRRGPLAVPPRTIAISFGGTDAGGQTAIALEALIDSTDADVEVVLGTAQAMTPRISELARDARVRVHVALPSMVPVLSRADLVLGAGGTATWERLCLGVPALVTTVSEGQSGVTRTFHEAGITRWLGLAADVTPADYREALNGVMAGRVPDPVPLVDGHGAARVGLAVLPDQGAVSVRALQPSDLPSFITSGPTDRQGPASWRARMRRFGEVAGESAWRVVTQAGVPVGLDGPEGTDVPGPWLDPVVNKLVVKAEAK